jgi:hypothetical protein
MPWVQRPESRGFKIKCIKFEVRTVLDGWYIITEFYILQEGLKKYSQRKKHNEDCSQIYLHDTMKWLTPWNVCESR